MATNPKERSQKEKSRLLKILVFSFAVLIILAWIFNLQNRLKNIEDLTLVPKNDEFSEIKNSLDGVIENLNTKLKDDKETLLKKAQEDGLGQESADKIDSGNSENSDLIITPIIEEPVVKPELNNCPAYINCMPTIGGPARSCAIPPGCEEITQVVW